jgi:glycerol-3-phosphate dehydrogenase
VPPSVTDNIPLVGAEGYHALSNQVDLLARRHQLPVWRLEALLNRYGSLVEELFALIEEDRTLAEPVPGAEEYLKVELLYGASHEGALHLDDLLARRTRISIETKDRGVRCARPVAELVADSLGWDRERVDDEVQAWEARVQAERESQTESADHEANAERLAAPDVRARSVGRALT